MDLERIGKAFRKKGAHSVKTAWTRRVFDVDTSAEPVGSWVRPAGVGRHSGKGERMQTYGAGNYDAIVLGAGHAGCEAALALARMGYHTLCLTINLDAVALMACNPAIGGTSKGHLVREVDALGGEMGLAADDTFIQMRMINTGKGPAVHSLRAQMDKRRYHERMKRALEEQENLELKMGECTQILVEHGRVTGILAAGGIKYGCRAVVVATGVYMKSTILIGSHVPKSGPSGLLRSE